MAELVGVSHDEQGVDGAAGRGAGDDLFDVAVDRDDEAGVAVDGGQRQLADALEPAEDDRHELGDLATPVTGSGAAWTLPPPSE